MKIENIFGIIDIRQKYFSVKQYISFSKNEEGKSFSAKKNLLDNDKVPLLEFKTKT